MSLSRVKKVAQKDDEMKPWEVKKNPWFQDIAEDVLFIRRRPGNANSLACWRDVFRTARARSRPGAFFLRPRQGQALPPRPFIAPKVTSPVKTAKKSRERAGDEAVARLRGGGGRQGRRGFLRYASPRLAKEWPCDKYQASKAFLMDSSWSAVRSLNWRPTRMPSSAKAMCTMRALLKPTWWERN